MNRYHDDEIRYLSVKEEGRGAPFFSPSTYTRPAVMPKQTPLTKPPIKALAYLHLFYS